MFLSSRIFLREYPMKPLYGFVIENNKTHTMKSYKFLPDWIPIKYYTSGFQNIFGGSISKFISEIL